MVKDTDIVLSCQCGGKAAVFQTGESRWYAHCPACGTMQFWRSPMLTARAKAGGRLCPHNPERKACKDGHSQTSWCAACRVRVFAPIPIGERTHNTKAKESGRKK